MNSDYDDVFNLEGPLARALPGYAYRPEQAAMAKAVGAALARLEPLIVEAGTGTGKTFAYLVPALLSGRSVIISTGTRTLQDQLFRRDVPLLAKALGLPVKIALLKGRANYLCRHRLELATQQGSLLPGERGVARVLARVARWAATTKAGDLSELTDLPEQSTLWPNITSTRENCLGQECPQFGRCHVFEARRNAQAADIVVVNHHLLLADLALKDEGFGDLLPGAEAVILDEAHQVPDTAAQFFGQVWSVRQVQILLRDIAAEVSAAGVRAPAINTAVAAVESRLEELRGTVRGQGRYEWASLPDAFLDALPDIETALSDIATQLDGLGAGAGTANCARRSCHARQFPGGAARAVGRHGIALGRCQCQRSAAALHALRNRRTPARVRGVAALRLGLYLRDLGHRRRFLRILRRASVCRTRARCGSTVRSTIRIRRAFFCRRACRSLRSRALPSGSSMPARPCSRRAAAARFCSTPVIAAWRRECGLCRHAFRSRRFRCWCRARRRAKRC